MIEDKRELDIGRRGSRGSGKGKGSGGDEIGNKAKDER